MELHDLLNVIEQVKSKNHNCKFIVKEQKIERYGNPDYTLEFEVWSSAYELERLLIADGKKSEQP